MDSRPRLHEGRLYAGVWVPASARTTRGGGDGEGVNVREGRHEGRPYVRLGGGRGWVREDNEEKGNKIPRLRFAALGMTCGAAGDGFLPPSSRG